jgi:sigma-B regulation protein RsbU (phosphoserine phosphatase)
VQEAHRESEERYRELIESAHDIIQSIQPDGSLAFVNRAWHKILGYTETELASLNLFDIIHPDSLPHCQELFSKVLTGQSVANIPAVFVAKDGTKVSIEGNVSPRMIDGKVVSTHGIFRDVTERNVAQEVQQSLLPQHPPKEKRFDLAGSSIYCDETGGDYYDYIELPQIGPDVYGIVVGDVSGHGISSALEMASIRAYLRGRATQGGSVAEIITDTNHLVSTDTTETGQFMTLFFLKIEAQTGRLTWVRAGHDPVLLYSPDSDHFEKLEGAGLPLGVDENWQYTEYTATVDPGQTLLLFTDGILEDRNIKGEMFGKNRFKDVIRRNADLGAEGLHKAIIDAVTTFQGEAQQEDDITLVVLKFL